MNISGCWSYLVEIYCRTEADSETGWVLLNGRTRMLLCTSVSRRATSAESLPTKPSLRVQKDDAESDLYKMLDSG